MLKKISKGLVVAVAISASTVSINAENMATPAPQATQATINPKALNMAKELVSEMNLKSSYEETIKRLTKDLIRNYPKLASVEDKILGFYSKYLGWDAIKDDLAKIYAKHFNEKELKDLIDFYKSPTGKKTLKELPVIMMEGRELGQNKVKAHSEELNKIIKEAFDKK